MGTVKPKPNRSGALEMKLGKTVWIEAFVLLIEGQDEEGKDVGETIEPFRTREKADAYAKAAFPGFDYKILPTWEDKRWARFKGTYKPKKR